MVLSPQNPFKEKKSLADDYVRLEMLEKSLENQTKIKVSTIEFDLPLSSYTIDTLTYLQEENPEILPQRHNQSSLYFCNQLNKNEKVVEQFHQDCMRNYLLKNQIQLQN